MEHINRLVYHLSNGLYLRTVESVVTHPVIQAIVYSTYVSSFKALEVPANPFFFYAWVISSFEIHSPEVFSSSIAEKIYSRKQGHHLFKCELQSNVIMALRSRHARPSTCAIIFSVLCELFNVPYTLALIVYDDPKLRSLVRELSIDDERNRLMHDALANQRMIPASHSKLMPTLFVECYWKPVKQWVGVEFNDGLFNVGIIRPRHLPSGFDIEELAPLYLRKFCAKLCERFDPELCGGISTSTAQGSQSIDQELDIDELSDLELGSLGEKYSQPTISSEMQAPSTHITLESTKARLIHHDIYNAQLGYHLLHPFKVKNSKTIFEAGTVNVLSYNPYAGFSAVTARYTNVCKPKDLRAACLILNQASWHRQRASISDDKELKRCMYNAELFESDGRMMALLESGGARMPTSLSGFKTHPRYVVKSVLKRNEFLDTSIYRPVSVFKGEPVYKRENLVTLRTERDWNTRGRKVLFGHHSSTQSVKKKTGACIEEPLYDVNSTEPYTTKELQARLASEQKYIDVRKAQIPDGFMHASITHFPSCFSIVKKLELNYFVALRGYKYDAGNLKAIQDGVIIPADRFYEFERAHGEFSATKKKLLDQARDERALNCWTVFAKMLISINYSSSN